MAEENMNEVVDEDGDDVALAPKKKKARGKDIRYQAWQSTLS